MKRLHLFLLLVAALIGHVATASAQQDQRAMFIHRHDGSINVVFFSDIDSLVASPIGLDSVRHAAPVVHEIWTPDTVMRIPLADIDSVSFQMPPAIVKQGVTWLDAERQQWITRADSLTLTFSPLTPATLLPKVGDRLVTTDQNALFATGFLGRVKRVAAEAGAITVDCSWMALSEAFDRYYCVVEAACADNGGSKAPRRRASGLVQRSLDPLELKLAGDFGPQFKPTEYSKLGVGASVEYDCVTRPYLRYTYINDFGNLFYSVHIDFDHEFTSTWQLYGGFEVAQEHEWLHVRKPIEQVPFLMLYLKCGPRWSLAGNLALDFTRTDNYTSEFSYTYSLDPNIDHSPHFGKLRHTGGSHDITSLMGSVSLYGGFYVEVGLGIPEVAPDFVPGFSGGDGTGDDYAAKAYGRYDIGLQVDAEADLGKSIDDAATSTRLYEHTDDLAHVALSFKHGVTVGAEADIMGYHAGTQLSFMSQKELLSAGLFPRFSDTRTSLSADGATGLWTAVDGKMLLPTAVGFKVIDADGQPTFTSYAPESYQQGRFDHYDMAYRPDKLNHTYTAYPVFRLFDKYEVLATPAVEITSKLAPVTLAATDVTATSATLHGQLEGDATIEGRQVEAGFCYSTSPNPAASGTRVAAEISAGRTFALPLAQLQEATTYYCQAYLLADGTYYYGATTTFATPKLPDGAVDLGLSVLWATRNVGAGSDNEPGGLYGWADATGQETTYDVFDDAFQWVSPLYGGTNPPASISGTTLDIARRQWGGTWRLPTQNELAELIDRCRWEADSRDGQPGMKVTGPSGKSIFLPAAGYRLGDKRYDTTGGYYWTGTLDAEYTRNAVRLDFSEDDITWDTYVRYAGQLVRPVRGK